MVMSKNSYQRFISLLLLLLAVPQVASAYVDPGSGAMLWQIAAAAVIGSLFYVKRTLVWIKSHLGFRSHRAVEVGFRDGGRCGDESGNPDILRQ